MSRGEGKARTRRRRCGFCRRLFQPDPRLSTRQVACSDPECQKARKKQNQAEWLERHPGYYEGRYANTRRWLVEHPGYLARYRSRNPEKVERDNERRRKRRQIASETSADIQDSISLEPTVTEALTPYLAEASSADIQDSKWPQIVVAAIFTARYLERRYTRLDRHAPGAAVASSSAGTAVLAKPPG